MNDEAVKRVADYTVMSGGNLAAIGYWSNAIAPAMSTLVMFLTAAYLAVRIFFTIRNGRVAKGE